MTGEKLYIGMKECTLEEILEAREDRMRRREALQKEKRCPVISMTMNIPGAMKDSPMIEHVFDWYMGELQTLFGEDAEGDYEALYKDTGPELLWAVRRPAREVKRAAIRLEEQYPAGRLLDIDVFDEEGNAISRTDLGLPERGCLVCGAPGRACASRQLHPIGEVRAEAERRMKEFLLEKAADVFAETAKEALVAEVNITPKPGLVDRRNNGSHRDMDHALMKKSARALAPYFRSCFMIGVESLGETQEETFLRLNRAGREAEKTMFDATGGVNTHKGAIYLFGILLGALGRLWRIDSLPETEELLLECGRIAKRSVEESFAALSGVPEEKMTAGQRIYLHYGLRGARGEAADGFPSIREIALPFLREHEGEENVWPRLLLYLIAAGKDTNLIARGGMDGAEEAVAKVRALIEHGEPGTEEIEALDDWFIERRLSPGGCADLLALTVFLDTIRNDKWRKAGSF